MKIDFETDPSHYRHWKIDVDGEVATLTIDVDENAGLFEGYSLKLNSYDLGVDIELSDAVQRLRFEHPQVKTVILRSAKDRVFCAGANIRMLAGSTHAHKVNFCKFTNETRNSIEDASACSGQKYLCVINGTAAGGGYELALATDHIVMVDDGSAAVSLPEVPLLAVLPGTGGLTRVTDKRKVRRDHADVFCTVEEGVKGSRAVDWRLVDDVARNSELEDKVRMRAEELARQSNRPSDATGIKLDPLNREFGENHVTYSYVEVEFDRENRIADIMVRAPKSAPPTTAEEAHKQGDAFWPLALARELDDVILHIRNNELEIALIQFRSQGTAESVLAYDAFMHAHEDHWLINEIVHYWKRVLKRVDLTSRSIFTLVEPGSCFAGTLAELVFAADRSYMLIGEFEGDNRPEAEMHLNGFNFGAYPMSNGITRLQTKFLGEPESVDGAHAEIGNALSAEDAEELGLVTFAYDDIDWEDEVRLAIEERASFSPDALTGMEANLRFAGPETMETKIFGRLTAWQNWIFQRGNAAGAEGALRRYGTGEQADFDFTRV
ncbi:MAG: 2,3-epoxybenzoyl-CoA dihydrolase [Hyphomicrobiales bacterium]